MATAPAILDTVSSFLDEQHRLWIDGDWVPAASGQTFAVENPAREETISHVARGAAEDINRAVRAARRAFDEGAWRRTNPAERGSVFTVVFPLAGTPAEASAERQKAPLRLERRRAA